MPNILSLAKQRLACLRKKIDCGFHSMKKCQEIIDLQLKYGYEKRVEQCSDESKPKIYWYLPHYSAIHPHKDKTYCL